MAKLNKGLAVQQALEFKKIMRKWEESLDSLPSDCKPGVKTVLKSVKDLMKD